METRESYLFDAPIGEFPGGHPRTFAVSADQRTYYVAFGANAGITLLAHYEPNGDVAIGSWLHAGTLRNVGQQGEAHYVRGWLKRAADALRPERLTPMIEVPGFGTPAEGEEWTYHADGWFSRGTWALALPVPDFLATGTTVWDIREGIYLAFPDGSCRLIARRDHGATYRQWEEFMQIGHDYADHPDGAMRRQGDIFVVSRNPLPYSYPPPLVQAVEVKAGATLNRHVVVGKPSPTGDGEVLQLEHPQHDTLGVMQGDWLVMLPGVSRPFSRRGGIGD